MTAPYRAPYRLSGKLCSAQDAAALIPEGAVVAASGYTAAGDPKAVLLALAERGRAGDIRGIDLITAAQLSPRVEDALAGAGILNRRAPFTVAGGVRERANAQRLRYVEVSMARMPRVFAAGGFGVPDVAVVEALGLDDEGRLIPTTSVGMTQLMCAMARRIIVEINTAQPELLLGLHDVYEGPAHAGTALGSAGERVGRPYVRIDLDKVAAVTFSRRPDELAPPAAPTPEQRSICENLLAWLDRRFPGKTLPPVQTGIGGLSGAVVEALKGSRYEKLTFFCGALQAGMVEMLVQGKAELLSGGSIVSDPETLARLKCLGGGLRERLVLRSMEVCNGYAAVSGLGVLALNTGLEMDVFGNVNASHIGGTRVVNGIGNGAAFAAAAGWSVMLLPAARKDGQLSCIVPAVGHVDVIHHDVDVVVSEFGVAELRGRDDGECARQIIENCAHPAHRQSLWRALERGLEAGGHHPLPGAAE